MTSLLKKVSCDLVSSDMYSTEVYENVFQGCFKLLNIVPIHSVVTTRIEHR